MGEASCRRSSKSLLDRRFCPPTSSQVVPTLKIHRRFRQSNGLRNSPVAHSTGTCVAWNRFALANLKEPPNKGEKCQCPRKSWRPPTFPWKIEIPGFAPKPRNPVGLPALHTTSSSTCMPWSTGRRVDGSTGRRVDGLLQQTTSNPPDANPPKTKKRKTGSRLRRKKGPDFAEGVACFWGMRLYLVAS